MTSAITRCPKCATSFRISETHLNSAKGSVRCGSCLSIFNAKQHIVPPPEKPTNSGQKRSASATPSAAPKTEQIELQLPTKPNIDDEDDMLISDDMDHDCAGGYAYDDDIYLPETGQLAETNLFEREVAPKNQEEVVSDDDSWALNLLNEKDEPEEQEEEHQERPNIFLSDDDYEEAQEFEQEHEAKKEQEVAAEQYNTDTFKIIDDDYVEPENETDEDLYGNEESHASTKPDQHAWNDQKRTSNPASESEFDFYDEEEDAEEEPDSTYDFIQSIEPEPVEFAYRKNLPVWKSRGFFAALSVLLMLILIAQIMWLRFSELNTVSPYRGFYAASCKIIGCNLDPLIDPDRIRINQLVVRTHPNSRQALVVDAVISNNAPFNQPFPNLKLVFTDIKNTLVAERVFNPGEYISGELKGRKDMPSRQPISISFEITDPGEQAVNYLLTISK